MSHGLLGGRAGFEPGLAALKACAPSFSLWLMEPLSYLLDIGCVLLHGDLLQGTFKAKEGPDVKGGGLLKASPIFILRVDLKARQGWQHSLRVADAMPSSRLLLVTWAQPEHAVDNMSQLATPYSNRPHPEHYARYKVLANKASSGGARRKQASYLCLCPLSIICI